jgi:uncharacterized membrane protein (DUF485 family)
MALKPHKSSFFDPRSHIALAVYFQFTRSASFAIQFENAFCSAKTIHSEMMRPRALCIIMRPILSLTRIAFMLSAVFTAFVSQEIRHSEAHTE